MQEVNKRKRCFPREFWGATICGWLMVAYKVLACWMSASGTFKDSLYDLYYAISRRNISRDKKQHRKGTKSGEKNVRIQHDRTAMMTSWLERCERWDVEIES